MPALKDEPSAGAGTRTRIFAKAKKILFFSSSGKNDGDQKSDSSYCNQCNSRSISSDGGAVSNPDRRKSVEDGRGQAEVDKELQDCIDCIETLKDLEGLTPEQQAAISKLRHLSNKTASPRVQSKRRGGFNVSQRRDAKFFGFGSGLGVVSQEFQKLVDELNDDEDDIDQQMSSAAVLSNFGGQVFSKVISSRSRDDDEAGDIICHSSSLKLSMLEEDGYGEASDSEAEEKSPYRRHGGVNLKPLDLDTSSLENIFLDERPSSKAVYCPPEWNALTLRSRTQLCALLSWENLSKWDFNVLDVDDQGKSTLCSVSEELCEGECDEDQKSFPLLLVGWAILCAPLAQQAMEGSLGDNSCEGGSDETSSKGETYEFCSKLSIDPEKLCNFLREIESGYNPNVPYHNNIHAADVTQTLHCLIQSMNVNDVAKIWQPVDIFSILLAATFHDVGHDGRNNLFHKNARTALAVRYNDQSILENMHSAFGHSLLMGEEKKDQWDVLQDWNTEQIEHSRKVMMRAILATDMSSHFDSLGSVASNIEQLKKAYSEDAEKKTLDIPGGDEGRKKPPIPPTMSILSQIINSKEIDEGNALKKLCRQTADSLLKFLVHAADISNPSKGRDLAIYWADVALAEFFAQGDKEETMGLPISPLCDRRTVKRADSQIGFLKFVVQPTFQVLAQTLPWVEEEVLHIIEENIAYWTKDKRRLSMAGMKSKPILLSQKDAKRKTAFASTTNPLEKVNTSMDERSSAPSESMFSPEGRKKTARGISM